jgi:hypothetical protein
MKKKQGMKIDYGENCECFQEPVGSWFCVSDKKYVFKIPIINHNSSIFFL